jgi:hypothetical protein
VTFETFTAYTVRKALDINEAHQSAKYCSDASALADDRRSKAQGHYHAVAIRSTRGEVMYVDTQGYDYCRYVLIPV